MSHYNGTLKIFIADEDEPCRVSPYGGPWHMWLSSTCPWHNGWALSMWFFSTLNEQTHTVILEDDISVLDEYTVKEILRIQKNAERYEEMKANGKVTWEITNK
jgi:hypothetical protein